MNPHELEDYLEQHSTPPGEVQQELIRTTHLKTMLPRMLSGPVQGRFLEILSKLIRPERILEIGTFTGYSAISLAQGLAPGGLLYTIEKNEEYEDIIRDFIRKAGCEHNIRLLMGNAVDIIPGLNETFDLIFIDAAKDAYPEYYDLVIDKLRTGGILLADNVLWSGKVLNKNANDSETMAIRIFNKMVAADNRVEQVLLPLRDGLMVVRKI